MAAGWVVLVSRGIVTRATARITRAGLAINRRGKRCSSQSENYVNRPVPHGNYSTDNWWDFINGRSINAYSSQLVNERTIIFWAWSCDPEAATEQPALQSLHND